MKTPGMPAGVPEVMGVADMGALEFGEGSTVQILAVWSAEQVARWRTSGESRTRVMYVAWAVKRQTGTREVVSRFCIIRQTKTLPYELVSITPGI